ncbi:MAG: kelch repeat-containing protein [Thermoplasmata archaeon]
MSPAGTSWDNISNELAAAPSNRSASQAAYSPELNATILFGGYNGAGGNYPLGDTWEYTNVGWTELSASGGPAPRWGGAMVYFPAMKSLVLFGGRNDTTFFNDTWTYNETGWHQLPTSAAPSPRYYFGLVFDPALGELVLFGGGIGNIPAGTFTGFVFYNDTWTFDGSNWLNITSSSGLAPPGRLMRSQMAYDAVDGYVVLAGGFTFVSPGSGGPCPFVTFDTAWASTWTFGTDGWSELLGPNASPPPGIGTIWYDSQANVTLYYEGMQNGSAGGCQVSGDEVWGFSAGGWTLVSEANITAPEARFLSLFFDDPATHQQILFGGELVASASESYGVYGHDTWAYAPTWVTFEAQGQLPSGYEWQVSVADAVRKSSGTSVLFVVPPGNYTYEFGVINAGHTLIPVSGGELALVRAPEVVSVSIPSGLVHGSGPSPLLSPDLAAAILGGTVGVLIAGAWTIGAGVRSRRLEREDGGRLLRSLEQQVRPKK